MRKWFKFLHEQKDTQRVSKIILFNGDKILLLISKNKPYAGKLDLPGGHLLHNEAPAVGLSREIKEETGLIVTNYTELYKDGNIFFFWGHLPMGDITLSNEHTGYELLNIDEIGEKGYKMSDIFFEAIKRAYEEAQKA
tara:strand:+ start:264 stop:677 length:414 start_codon:yes stop_codon:yes gene_type:complete